jgi:hypothetical protein
VTLGTDDGAKRTAKITAMWKPDTEQTRIEAELADVWWQAQHLVWHSPAWEAAMVAIDDFHRDLNRINLESWPFDEMRFGGPAARTLAGQQDPS